MKKARLDFKAISDMAKIQGIKFKCFVPFYGSMKGKGWFYLIDNIIWSPPYNKEFDCKYDMFLLVDSLITKEVRESYTVNKAIS